MSALPPVLGQGSKRSLTAPDAMDPAYDRKHGIQNAHYSKEFNRSASFWGQLLKLLPKYSFREMAQMHTHRAVSLQPKFTTVSCSS